MNHSIHDGNDFAAALENHQPSQLKVDSRLVQTLTYQGVTFTFQNPVLGGYYSSGEPFAVDNGTNAIVLAAITPNASGGQNGAMLNPDGSRNQAYDSRGSSFNSALQLNLPVTLSAGDSVVKAVSISPSDSDCTLSNGSPGISDIAGYCASLGHAMVKKAARLSVVDSVPFDHELAMPIYGTRAQKLASRFQLDPILVKFTPSYANTIGLNNRELQTSFEYDWLTDYANWTARYVHAVKQMPNYGEYFGRTVGYGLQAMTMDFSDSLKELILRRLMTYAMDLRGLEQSGQGFIGQADGGHLSARWAIVRLAALIFRDPLFVRMAKSTQWHDIIATHRGRNGLAYFGIEDSSAVTCQAVSSSCVRAGTASSCGGNRLVAPVDANFHSCYYFDINRRAQEQVYPALAALFSGAHCLPNSTAPSYPERLRFLDYLNGILSTPTPYMRAIGMDVSNWQSWSCQFR